MVVKIKLFRCELRSKSCVDAFVSATFKEKTVAHTGEDKLLHVIPI
jgi:hypothetical protein